MALIPNSIGLTGLAAPKNDIETFPTIDATWGIGGYREVATVAVRDAIPLDRRRFGMVAWVNADSVALNNTGYRLCNIALGGIDNNLSNNANWKSSNTATTLTNVATVKEFYITGDGASATFSFTHNLNNRKVKINVGKDFGTYEEIDPRRFATTLDSATIVFQIAPALTENYNVVVIGIDKSI